MDDAALPEWTAASVTLDRADTAGDGRTVEVRLMSWGEVADTPQGRETFARTAFGKVDPADIALESQRHDGELVGVGTAWDERDDGPYLVGRVSDTAAGRDLLTLLSDGAIRAASVAFVPRKSSRRPDGVIVREVAELRRVALLHRGAYRSAGVVAVREDQTMADPIEAPAPDVPGSTVQTIPGTATTPPMVLATASPSPELLQLRARMDSADEAIARLGAGWGIPAPLPGGILDRRASLGDVLFRAMEDPAIHAEVQAELQRALADQTTTDNPGLVPPAWIKSVQGIIARPRGSVIAFGSSALPESGMTVNWPKVSAATLADGPWIGVQATQKSEIVSAKVSFDSAASNIVTYAGGSDIALQLIRRSSPAYREQYARFMLAQWAKITNNAFVAALVAGATTGATVGPGATAQAVLAWLFSESVAIEAATGQPADIVLAATDVFTKLGQLPGLWPQPYGTANVAGTATASTLRINISGLDIIHEPAIPAGKAIVSTAEAAEWYEDGPFTIEATDVVKLGLNVAYWSMAAPALFVPPAIRISTVGIAADELSAEGESKGRKG